VSWGAARGPFLQIIFNIYEKKLILTKMKDRTVAGVLKILFPPIIQLNNSNMNDDILFFPKKS